MENRIEFVQSKRVSRRYKDKDLYSYRPKGRCPMLQRALFACLRVLKCDGAIYDELSFERQVIQPKSFMEALHRQHREILQRAHDVAGIVVMGPDEFSALGHELNAHQAISFKAPYSVDYRVMGMKIVVVPWINGIFVMPDVKHIGR